MKKLQNHLIGVDQGETRIFSDFQDGGPMWSGTGARESVKAVRFSETFRHPPVVHVSLSMWDINSGANPRVELLAANVTAAGFDIVFHTWGDTQIARANANWIAIGEVPHADDWELD